MEARGHTTGLVQEESRYWVGTPWGGGGAEKESGFERESERESGFNYLGCVCMLQRACFSTPFGCVCSDRNENLNLQANPLTTLLCDVRESGLDVTKGS